MIAGAGYHGRYIESFFDSLSESEARLTSVAQNDACQLQP